MNLDLVQVHKPRGKYTRTSVRRHVYARICAYTRMHTRMHAHAYTCGNTCVRKYNKRGDRKEKNINMQNAFVSFWGEQR